MKPKITYKVTLKKDFTYPKSMLMKGDERADAMYKAQEDLFINLNEIVNNRFENIDVTKLFQIECIEEKVFKLRKTNEKPQSSIGDIAHHLAQMDIEAKYGSLDLEDNPSIFVCEVQGNDEIWYLKENIERELEKRINEYNRKLNKFKKESFISDNYTLGSSTRRSGRRVSDGIQWSTQRFVVGDLTRFEPILDTTVRREELESTTEDEPEEDQDFLDPDL
jgi:hypothetical protein